MLEQNLKRLDVINSELENILEKVLEEKTNKLISEYCSITKAHFRKMNMSRDALIARIMYILENSFVSEITLYHEFNRNKMSWNNIFSHESNIIETLAMNTITSVYCNMHQKYNTSSLDIVRTVSTLVTTDKEIMIAMEKIKHKLNYLNHNYKKVLMKIHLVDSDEQERFRLISEYEHLTVKIELLNDLNESLKDQLKVYELEILHK